MSGGFSALNIATRLKVVGVSVAVLTLVLAGTGYSVITRLSESAGEMANRGLVGSKLLSDCNNTVWELRFGIANYTLASPEGRKKILEGRPALLSAFEESLEKFAAMNAESGQDPQLLELKTAFQQYKAGAPKWFELIDADKKEEAAEYRAKVTNAAGSVMVKNLRALIDKQIKTNEALDNAARASVEHAQHQLLFLSIGTVFLIAAVGSLWLLARTVAIQLGQIQREIEAVENSSDFTRRLTFSGGNEIGRTADAFNKLMVTMQASLRQLLQSVDQVSRAAAGLSTSSSTVAEGSSQQSQATTSIAATVEQVNSSIHSVSDNARQALAISSDSGELSSHGRNIIQKTVSEVLQIAEAMRQTSQAIGNLGQQSKEISSVVQVIKNVADQTNLLALNAAIEAARAGEQGRGFAVVADEVRKLAERTTKSTQEITQMVASIQESSDAAVDSMSRATEQMEGGVEMAKQAGEAIDQIQERSGAVTQVVKEIASSLAEQSSASHSISSQVENVARMTEVNSHAIEEISVAIRRLESLAAEMRSIGSRFRI